MRFIICGSSVSIATPSQDAEFDLACSQDWGDGGGDRARRRKVSVANKSIMV